MTSTLREKLNQLVPDDREDGDDTGKWDFGPEEEKQAIGFLLDHPNDFDYIEHLNPHAFNMPQYGFIAAHIVIYHREHDAVPTREILTDIVKRNMTVDDVGHEDVVKAVEENGDPRAYGHIKSKLGGWLKYRVFMKLYEPETMKAINSGEYEIVEKIVNEAEQVTNPHDHEPLEAIYDSLFDVAETDPLPLGIQLPGVELRGGRVLAYAAPTNVGKSAALIHAAVANVDAGNRVLFVTTEMQPRDILGRMVRNAMGETATDRRMPQVRAKLEAEWSSLLEIRYMDTVSPRQIAAMVAKLGRTTGRPQVVVIDYMDLMVPNERSSRNSPMYEQQKEVAKQLLALAGNLDLPIITAMQTNRQGEQKSQQHSAISLGELADSYGKAMPSDFIVTINRGPVTFGNSALKHLQFHVVKNRHGEVGGFADAILKGKLSRIIEFDRENPKWKHMIVSDASA